MQFFNLPYRHLFLFLLAVFTYFVTELCNVYHFFKIDAHWYTKLGTILLISLITWESARLMRQFIANKFVLPQQKWYFIGSFYLSTVIIASLLTVALVWVICVEGYQFDSTTTVNIIKLNLIYATLISLLFHLMFTVKFYVDVYTEKANEAEQLKRITSETELQLIKSQINPHFLFNNLNVLSALIMNNNDEANKFIEEFSKVYRYILSTQQQELVTLTEELDIMQPYIYLLKKRFGEGLIINMDIPQDAHHCYIIPASLQMLVENALKHNIVSHNKPLRITIDANMDSITVSNNLQPRSHVPFSTKIGLSNIKKRYFLVSGRSVEVVDDNTNFKVNIPLITLN